MAVWYDIIKNLRDYLRAETPAPAAHVEGGALNPGDLDLSGGGAIFLIRDHEREQLYRGGDGTVFLLAETWVRSDDPDPMVGYLALSQLEDSFKTALKAWVYAARAETLGADVTDVVIEDTVGDGDSLRPLLGSRTTIKIIWTKRTLQGGV